MSLPEREQPTTEEQSTGVTAYEVLVPFGLFSYTGVVSRLQGLREFLFLVSIEGPRKTVLSCITSEIQHPASI